MTTDTAVRVTRMVIEEQCMFIILFIFLISYSPLSPLAFAFYSSAISSPNHC